MTLTPAGLSSWRPGQSLNPVPPCHIQQKGQGEAQPDAGMKEFLRGGGGGGARVLLQKEEKNMGTWALGNLGVRPISASDL